MRFAERSGVASAWLPAGKQNSQLHHGKILAPGLLAQLGLQLLEIRAA